MVAYFGYHLVQGNQGLRAWHALDIKIAEAKETRDALAARRALISARKPRWPESLDPDMLTERARALLNHGHVHDVVMDPKGVMADAADIIQCNACYLQGINGN